MLMKNRTDGGEVYYIYNEEQNPNTFMQRTDYALTPIRKTPE